MKIIHIGDTLEFDPKFLKKDPVKSKQVQDYVEQMRTRAPAQPSFVLERGVDFTYLPFKGKVALDAHIMGYGPLTTADLPEFRKYLLDCYTYYNKELDKLKEKFPGIDFVYCWN